MHQTSDEDKASFDIIMGRTRRIQKRLSAVLHNVQEFEAKQIADRKAAIALLPVAERPKATTKSSLPSECAPPRKNKKLTDDEFINQFTLLGHRHSVVDNAHGFIIRCRNCKIQSRRQDFKHVLANGPCIPIAPVPRWSGVVSGLGSTEVSSVSVVSGSTGLASNLPGSQKQGPKHALKASVDDEPAPPEGAAKKRILAKSSALSIPSVPPLLAEPPIVGKKRLHRSHRLEHCRGIIICTRCGYFSVTRARELTRPCTGKPTINTRKYLDRWSQGLTPKAALSWPETFDSLASGLIWRPE